MVGEEEAYTDDRPLVRDREREPIEEVFYTASLGNLCEQGYSLENSSPGGAGPWNLLLSQPSVQVLCGAGAGDAMNRINNI
jgi:hypothetical protein